MARQPRASITRACIWIIGAWFVAVFLVNAEASLFRAFGIADRQLYVPGLGIPGIEGDGRICISASGPVTVLGILLAGWVSKLIGRVFGGVGGARKMVFLASSFVAPLLILGTILAMVPLIALINFPLLAYAAYLFALAVRSVHGLDWSRSIATGLLTFACVVAIPVLAFLVLMLGFFSLVEIFDLQFG